jgi:4-diphosphocytidyl-2-C-methyl-D-erythritol kinase
MTMSSPGIVREACRAKLNLYLDVTGRRADGYHDLLTVFHEIELADDLEARLAPGPRGAVTLELVGRSGSDGTAIPADERNLAVRAARALLRQGGSQASVALRLVKRIPTAGGLGGGSADAAGALRAVNRLLGLGASMETLEKIGLDLGSDVPFLVRGGTAIGRGRGEILERVDGTQKVAFGLLHPDFGLGTPAVYAQVRPPYGRGPGPGAVVKALQDGDARALGAACWNALEEPAARVEPRLAEALEAARAACGPLVHMTGSGSTLFVPDVFRDIRTEFTRAQERFRGFRGFTLWC